MINREKDEKEATDSNDQDEDGEEGKRYFFATFSIMLYNLFFHWAQFLLGNIINAKWLLLVLNVLSVM